MVSVFTAAHETGRNIALPLDSLLSQTSRDWEWVVVDDSTGWETADLLEGFAASSALAGRLRVERHSSGGSIGSSKAAAAALCRGDVLLELDHDDQLLPTAVADVAAAFARRSDVDFVYSDWIDRVEDASGSYEDVELYPPGWAFGFGSYAYDLIDGAYVPVALAPAITTETVRHIVSMPNHLRAWRTSAYRRIGGHDPSIPVGDDYELLVRTFLSCRMARIPWPLYVQHHASTPSSASRRRNAEIQQRVAQAAAASREAVDARCEQLGLIANPPAALTASHPLSLGSALLHSNGALDESGDEPFVSFVLATSCARPSDAVIGSILSSRHERFELLLVGLPGSAVGAAAAAAEDSRVRYACAAAPGDATVAELQRFAANAMSRGRHVLKIDDRVAPSEEHLLELVDAVKGSRG